MLPEAPHDTPNGTPQRTRRRIEKDLEALETRLERDRTTERDRDRFDALHERRLRYRRIVRKVANDARRATRRSG